MEMAVERYYPTLLSDTEYQRERTIEIAHETSQGYPIILESAGFHNIQEILHDVELVSQNEQEFWWQTEHLGWEIFLQKIEEFEKNRLLQIKHAIFQDLQPYKHAGGTHFTQGAFFMSGEK